MFVAAEFSSVWKSNNSCKAMSDITNQYVHIFQTVSNKKDY